MQSFAKSILITLIVTAAVLMISNFIYFFPFYTTLVVETFNVSQKVATDNYMKESDFERELENLKNRAIYNKRPEQVEIIIKNADDQSAVGYDDPERYLDEGVTDDAKPYRQRGEPLTVTVKAVYPLTITLWGEPYVKEIPVSFTLKTTGLKHYKDLEYYNYLPEGDLSP